MEEALNNTTATAPNHVVSYSHVDINHPDGDNVLREVNFTVDEGEFVYLTGRVGSGKTSLLKTLYGELDIAAGQATVLGFDLANLKRRQLPELRRRIGIVFHDFKLLTDRNVHHNLDFVLRATGWHNAEERQQRIDHVLQVVELSHKRDAMPYSLSSGEQQRICIARALLNAPKLLLADEATGNQDPEASQRTLSLLHQLADEGTAVILSTHNMALLHQFPGTILHLADHQLTRSQAHDDIPEAVVDSIDEASTLPPTTEE